MSGMSNSTASTTKLVVNSAIKCTEVVDTVNDSTDSTFCAESSEPHGNHLQVPKDPALLVNKMDAHKNSETSHISLRSSLANIAAEVFTTESITIALKCRVVTTLVVIICLMVLLFLAPIIWYNTDPPSAEAYVTEKTIFYNLELDSCAANCPEPDPSWLIEHCKVNITEYQECELNSAAILGLHSIYNLGLNSSTSECGTNDALSFFCNATLLLCNGDSPSVDLTEECEKVRDGKCASEWRLVENICNRTVPNCASYATKDENITHSKAPQLPCPSGFDHFCGSLCLPVCGEYFLATERSSIYYYRFVAAIGGILGIITGIISIIVCFYNSHKLLQFPRIFIVYNIIIWEIYLSLIMLPFMSIISGHSPMCTDRNYVKNIRKRVFFCEIQGFIVQLLYSCFVGFWCFHLLHLFLGLVLPFKMKVLMDSSSWRRKVHITEVVIVVLASSLSPIIAVSVTTHQDNGSFCVPQSNSVTFYGGLLPGIAVFCIGLVFIFTSLWILRKKHHSTLNNTTVGKIFCVDAGCSDAEIKLSLLFCYYILVMLSYFSAQMVHLMTKDQLVASTDKYIACSLGGAREECEEYKAEAVKSLDATLVLVSIAIFLYSMINFTHLIYVIRFQAVKEAMKKIFHKQRS